MQAGGDALALGGEVVVAADRLSGIVCLDLYAPAFQVRDGIVRDGHCAVPAGADDEYLRFGGDDLLQVLGREAVALHAPPVRDDATRQDYHVRPVLATVDRYATELVRVYLRRHVDILADDPPGVEFFVAAARGLSYLRVG
jgi:hypothetical protein